MNIIYCAEPFNEKNVDSDWQIEAEIASNLGMPIHVFDYDAIRYDNNVAKALRKIKNFEFKTSCVYRGWMMPVDTYEELYNGLLAKNLQLINNPAEYKYCYHLPESYEIIKSYTPQTLYIKTKTTPEIDELEKLSLVFGNKPIILKDYVKSQKHHWHEACYIPDASDIAHVQRVIKRFIELQGDNFEGGLVFREFVALESVGIHPKSNMPLTMEYRVFILHGKPIAILPYWNEGSYAASDIPLKQFSSIFSKIKSNFYTIDIAKLKNGDWIIIELGDGQVAEYMNANTLSEFYKKINAANHV